MMPETNLIEEIRTHLIKQQSEMVALLKTLVEAESPSNDKAAVDALGQLLNRELNNIGFTVEVVPQRECGDHLRATWGSGKFRLLTLCHMDTVWPLGEITSRPFTLDDNLAWGPGVNDMKSGIVSLLFAVKALSELGIDPGVEIVALFTSDEEVGSLQSRSLIEQEAQRCDAALIFEPGTAQSGGIKTWRKGVALFNVEITGRAAHAGANPEAGASAITELAHQILQIQALADTEQGTTVSVGLVQGGAKPNIIPAYAKAVVDVRIRETDEAERILKSMQALTPIVPGTSITVSGGINRYPMQKTEHTEVLYHLAARLSEQIGVPVAEEGSGGATDGNLVAVYGIPVLDGVGPLGAGSHSVNEYCEINTIPLRAALAALICVQLGTQTN